MASIQYYDVIIRPVITEKSMNAMGEKKYTFLVHPEANKTQIKEAVEKMFEGTKVKRWKEKTPWNGSWKNCQDQKGYRSSYRREQGYRDLRRTLIRRSALSGTSDTSEADASS